MPPKPRSFAQQIAARKFNHSVRIAVYFAEEKFDAVWRENQDGEVTQAMGDLGSFCTRDIREMREALRFFQFCEDDELNLDSNPRWIKQINPSVQRIKKRMELNPEKYHVLAFIMAGHGMNFKGTQAVVLNEFCKSKGWYKFWAIEDDCRDIAKRYTNSYVLAVFACCRELYSQTKHHDGCAGPEGKAIEHFRLKNEEIRIAKQNNEIERANILELKQLKESFDKMIET